jgi:hypothetical protein
MLAQISIHTLRGGAGAPLHRLLQQQQQKLLAPQKLQHVQLQQKQLPLWPGQLAPANKATLTMQDSSSGRRVTLIRVLSRDNQAAAANQRLVWRPQD